MAERKEEFEHPWDDPEQCAGQVRLINDICVGLGKVWEAGKDAESGRDSIGGILYYTSRMARDMSEACKKLDPKSEEHIQLSAELMAVEMLMNLADEIQDGHYDEYFKELGVKCFD